MIEDTGFGLFDLGDAAETADLPGQEPLFGADEVPATDASPLETGEDLEVTEGGGLFGTDEDFHVVWREWQGMPEFHSDDLMPWYQIVVNFAEPEHLEAFAKLVGVPLNATQRRTTSMWYPPQLRFGPSAIDKRYRDPHEDAYWRRVPSGTRKDPNALAVEAAEKARRR